MKKVVFLVISLTILSFIIFYYINSKQDLYPAYKTEKNVKLWGYIDIKAGFKIKPQYKSASDFKYDIALVESLDGNSYVINKKNEKLLELKDISPKKIYIKPSSILILSNRNEEVKIYNKKGKLKETISGDFCSIMDNFIVSEDGGFNIYYDLNGEKINDEPVKSLISLPSGEYIIKKADDIFYKTGKNSVKYDFEVFNADDDYIVYYDPETYRYGYADTKSGKKITPPVYEAAELFNKGFAYVCITDEETGEFSEVIIDEKFENVTEIGAFSFEKIDNDFYKVFPIENHDFFKAYALADYKGEALNNFDYYNIQKAGEGVFSISDRLNTNLFDYNKKEQVNLNLPSALNIVNFKRGVFKAQNEIEFSYYHNNRKIYSSLDEDIIRTDYFDITSNAAYNDIFSYIYYPLISGMEDETIENFINYRLLNNFEVNKKSDTIRKLLSEDYVTFDCKIYENILVINKYIYKCFNFDLGIHYKYTYNINISDGEFYYIGDIFKEGYEQKLRSLINEQIKLREENGEIITKDGKLENNFKNANIEITEEGFNVYFQPYDISPENMLITEFFIKREDMKEFIK